ncbi:hypothetical protein GH5_05180 [Leishmania sp. Ghana 2012 LV757]|uniref:hypothetical protein n=1 Tax=Leishmania sp. Ghana 2012 LV757 TaxID=2803181 RepID=UPI001B3DF8EA|nr:hypothetical protein GH5_05180 [Leishmania sp. Ghana 2012 LV757]
MLRPSRPLRRSIDEQRREGGSSQSAKGFLVSRRIGRRSHAASTLFTTASAGGCTTMAPAAPAAVPNAEAMSAVPLPSLDSCSDGVCNASDLRGGHPPQRLTSSFPTTAADTVDAAAAVRKSAESYTYGSSKHASSPLKVATTHYTCLNVLFDRTDKQPHIPKSGPGLFTSTEVLELRSEARQAYARRRRMEERRQLIASEAEARSGVAGAALDQIAAVRELHKEERESLMRAASDAALPVQYLEQRIRHRIIEEDAKRDGQLRQEGRDAWRLHVQLCKEASEDLSARVVAYRAATHRFRAALTFIVVQEIELRKCVEVESAKCWEALVQEEAEGRADAERRALVRFLSSPEQLALTAAREQRERKRARRAAKLLRLFQEQQDGFVNGCRHGTGGLSLFVGGAPKKVCRRCRVKWDENLGYYVSMDRTMKIHSPPSPLTAAVGAGVKTAPPAVKQSVAEAAKGVSVLPPLKERST